MGERISAVNLLINSFLPEDLRDDKRLYDSKGTSALMTEIAKRYPDQYPTITKAIGDVGRKQAWTRGETFRLDDFRPVIDRKTIYGELDVREAEIVKNIIDPDKRRDALGELYGEFSARISKETNAAALKSRNNIALTVLSGARGKEAQLRDLISTPGFYTDANGRAIPGFVRRSFAEGVRPSDWLASTYSGRGAVTTAKTAVAKGGFLSKTLARAAATTYVSEKDCGTTNGIDLVKSEPDLLGRILQRDAGNHKAGEVITRKVFRDIKDSKVEDVIVRSPITCQAKHGICSKCFGVKAEGQFPKIGDHVGVTSSTALGEPLAQGALNCLFAATYIMMADGSSRRIDRIQTGDVVMGANLDGAVFPVMVTAVWDQGMQPVSRYTYRSHNEHWKIESTAAHPILAVNRHGMTERTPVSQARVVLTEDGIEAVICKVEEMGELPCYDLSVEHEDALFVLANGLIVKNTKHVTSASGPKQEFSGLDYLIQFTESPEEFKDKGIVASVDGVVSSIDQAPQGGSYIVIGDKKHYVPIDRTVAVKPGDTVEAGDNMSDGLVDPEDVMKYKGLGEARSYWASKMAQISKASGAGMDRRLFETLARANVDHIDLDDPEEEGFLPDDRVRYSEYVQRRNIPDKLQKLRATAAVGKYLEAPALHHTIGTRITPSIAEHLDKKGFGDVYVSEKEPGFRPVFVRLQQVASTDDDWLASLGGSYLGKNLQEGIMRAQDTNIEENNHPVPRMAVGVGYGDKLEETGKF